MLFVKNSGFAGILLPNNPQFHIRAYCIASGALELFVNPHFLTLFASAAYAHPQRDSDAESGVDLRAHLTNTSLQTPSPENPDPNDNVRLLAEMIGTPILSKEGGGNGRTLSAEDVEVITGLVYETLADTFRAALESSVHFQVGPLYRSHLSPTIQ